jgi:hypothetical protein
MRSRDVLGSIFAWLLCMQRVDSVSITDWTMRARCGTFLHKSGMMQNAMHLLLDLGKDLLKVKDLSNLLLRAVSVSSSGQLISFHKQQCFYPNMHVICFFFFPKKIGVGF